MLKKREIIPITISVILMTLILSFFGLQIQANKILPSFLISIIVIGVSIFSKKITGKIINVEVNLKIWQLKRYWFAKISEIKKPIPVGLILPLLLLILSNGYVKLLAFLQFEAIALPGRVTKKYGSRRFSGIMDWDDALIIFYSTIPLFLLAIISSTINSTFFLSLAWYSLLYSFCNLLPISSLDGTKIFFGSKPLYIFTWVLFLITALIVLI